MKVKHDTPAATKRKLSTSEEDKVADNSTPKQAKLDSKEQAKQGVARKENNRKVWVKPTPNRQTTTKGEMTGLKDMIHKVTSPSKDDNIQDGVANTEANEQRQAQNRADMAQMSQIADDVKTILKLQLQTNNRMDAIDDKVDAGLARVDENVANVVERVKALEVQAAQKDLKQGSLKLSAEVLHEQHCQEQIEESKRCVTLLGSGSQTLAVKELQQILIANDLAERGELEVVGVQRLGHPLSKTPAFKVELKSTAMATSLIENSKTKHAQGTSSVRCVRYFPEEYAERAREMKAMQSSIWRKGVQSQIYFEGTKMCLKVKERGSNIWMVHPSEFATFQPNQTMSATALPTDSDAMTKTRSSLYKKLNFGEETGRLGPDVKITRSLIFTSPTCHLTKSNVSDRLHPEVVKTIEEMETLDDAQDGKACTRLVFKSRSGARTALRLIFKEYRADYPLERGEFIELESVWDR